jgi:hypothetical protein
MTSRNRTQDELNGKANQLLPQDAPAHQWYRFVLSFPPHLVRDYVDRFELHADAVVLDPFCGTGTTLVECRKLGMAGVGLEANSMAFLAARTKTDWDVDPDGLLRHAEGIAERANAVLKSQGINDDQFFANPATGPTSALRKLSPEKEKLLLKGSISPLPLHKVLILLDVMAAESEPVYSDHERLALAKALVTTIGNLHFGPEVGVTRPKEDATVLWSWLDCVRTMVKYLRELREQPGVPSDVRLCDARNVSAELSPDSIDAVITSPPYPNEKDYTRTTRLESVLLGLISTKKELRELKESLIRSNTRNVYVGDTDDRWVAEHREIQRIARDVEARRIEMGKTSGFERLYHRVTKLYFGGMARHLAGASTGAEEGSEAGLRRRRPGLLPARVD